MEPTAPLAQPDLDATNRLLAAAREVWRGRMTPREVSAGLLADVNRVLVELMIGGRDLQHVMIHDDRIVILLSPEPAPEPTDGQ